MLLNPKRLEKTITDVALNFMWVRKCPCPTIITAWKYVGVRRGEGGLLTEYSPMLNESGNQKLIQTTIVC